MSYLEGHRQRLRDRFNASGLSAFEDHEVLELLLTYAVPRKDVKPIARTVLDRFGSLSNALDADTVDLTSLEGVGESGATLLHLSVDHYGTMIQVDAVGTRSRQFYPGIIVTVSQANELKIVSSAKGMDFSGDPDAFHLAIEALRIRLAYEYDPHFAVNASAITPLPHQFDAAYRQGVRAKKTRKTRLYRLGEELSVRTKHLLLLTARDAALVATVDGLNRRISIQLDGPVRSPSTAPNRGEA